MGDGGAVAAVYDATPSTPLRRSTVAPLLRIASAVPLSFGTTTAPYRGARRGTATTFCRLELDRFCRVVAAYICRLTFVAVLHYQCLISLGLICQC